MRALGAAGARGRWLRGGGGKPGWGLIPADQTRRRTRVGGALPAGGRLGADRSDARKDRSRAGRRSRSAIFSSCSGRWLDAKPGPNVRRRPDGRSCRGCAPSGARSPGRCWDCSRWPTWSSCGGWWPPHVRPTRPKLAYRAALDRLSAVGEVRQRGEPRERFAVRMNEIAPSMGPLTAGLAGYVLGSVEPPEIRAGAPLPRLAGAVGVEVRRAMPVWRWVLGILNPVSWWWSR